MKMYVTSGCFRVGVILLCLHVVVAAQAQTTVIKAGHIFDSRTGKTLNDQIILVRDGKITAVGPNLKYKNSDKIIDLSKSWLTPGLMDCHVHITDNHAYRNFSNPHFYLTESSSLRALRGAVVAEQFLNGGFTTIKEIGNDANYASADVIKAIQRGWFKGPTIFYAGKIIAPYGGQSRDINVENEFMWNFEYIDADTPDEIKKAVRKNIYYGANVIKLVSGDNGIYNEEDIRAAVEEAAKSNIRVTVHVMGGKAARNVILGGAAAIEHGFGLEDENLQLMKEKGTFLVGTDFSFDNFYAYGGDSARARAREKMVVDRLKRAYQIGTKMAFGTDIIIDIPGMNRVQTNLRVLETWKAAGIPAPYILQTMTYHAADLLGIAKTRGIIEADYWADIVAFDSNPADNIDVVRKVSFVMKEGKIIVGK